MRIKYLYFVVFFIFSCNGNTENNDLDKKESAFKQSLSVLSPKSNFNIYMVIPRAGCSGCISDAELYMQDYITKHPTSTEICFILTDFDSEKILRARFGSLLQSSQIIIDRDRIFGANELLKSIYPTFYFFDDAMNLKETGTFSPQTDGKRLLKKYLEKNNS